MRVSWPPTPLVFIDISPGAGSSPARPEVRIAKERLALRSPRADRLQQTESVNATLMTSRSATRFGNGFRPSWRARATVAPAPARAKVGSPVPSDATMAEEEAEAPQTGTFIFPTGGTGADTYEGEWKEREYAEGEEVPPPPEPVEGEDAPRTYVRHGRGKSQVAGKWSYDGEWNQDVMEGKGVFTYASGATYDGEWMNNAYAGQGTYTWPNGTSYVGQWENGAMHGQGTYTDEEGRQWTGAFYNNTGPGLKMIV